MCHLGLRSLALGLQTSSSTLDRARAFAIACSKGTQVYRMTTTSEQKFHCRGHCVKGRTWLCFKRSPHAIPERGKFTPLAGVSSLTIEGDLLGNNVPREGNICAKLCNAGN